MTGDRTDANGEKVVEEVEFHRRDALVVVKELMSNPAFRQHMRYAPIKVFKDSAGQDQVFDEMWTGDSWWRLQVRTCRRFVSGPTNSHKHGLFG